MTLPDAVAAVHARTRERLETVRDRLGRPLTLAEKVLFGHLHDTGQELERGHSYVGVVPDRLAMPDSSAQTALLQFMTTGMDRVGLPATVHCDHLVRARAGAGPDLERAGVDHAEVYEFLRTACARYGVGYWRPGSGIIHQVVLENYAFPGGLLVGTDSHTPNGGGLAMFAVGVGGAEAVDAMVRMPVLVRVPRLIGVRLTGRLRGWAAPKDVILTLAGILTAKGATGSVVEYFGPGARTLSATGKATICNMGAEIGATTSMFGLDDSMARYLRSTGRAAVADLCLEHAADLRADPEVEDDPERFFDRLVEIDLDRLEPMVSGPHQPDLVRTVSALGAEAAERGYPPEPSAALIGSCTNSSYEDIGRAAHVARQARAAGLSVRIPLYVSPGSHSVHATMERDGLLDDLTAIGATVLANACGPCIGQWTRPDDLAGKPNAIVTSFNRNFPRRNDGHEQTLAFMGSPELVVASALAGTLGFDPAREDLPGGLRLEPPSARELPNRTWVVRDPEQFEPPPDDGSQVTVAVDPDSERIRLIEPFAPLPPSAYTGMPVLAKATGPCTTDHISPAGPWLRLRGNLDRLSDNLFLGLVNAFTGTVGEGVDVNSADGRLRPLPVIARRYRERRVSWIVVGDENYGEGSSREHAAMEPRHLGCAVVLARSFARIHEANLKKQGVLPLVFADPGDYDRIGPADLVDVVGVEDLAPDRPVVLRVRHPDGGHDDVETRHSLDATQLRWLAAGSALNLVRARGAP